MLKNKNEGIDFFMAYFRSGNNISVERATIPVTVANAVLRSYNYQRVRAERAIEALMHAEHHLHFNENITAERIIKQALAELTGEKHAE